MLVSYGYYGSPLKEMHLRYVALCHRSIDLLHTIYS